MNTISKEEYAPFYANYINLANLNTSIVDNLKTSFQKFEALMATVPEEKELFQYEADKWTIRELVMHLMDAEMIFNYRALRFARKDGSALIGFDENDYVAASNANGFSLKELVNQYRDLRASTINLYQNFPKNWLERGGQASGSFMSVKALGYVTSGHMLHHLHIIESRYL